MQAAGYWPYGSGFFFWRDFLAGSAVADWPSPGTASASGAGADAEERRRADTVPL